MNRFLFQWLLRTFLVGCWSLFPAHAQESEKGKSDCLTRYEEKYGSAQMVEEKSRKKSPDQYQQVLLLLSEAGRGESDSVRLKQFHQDLAKRQKKTDWVLPPQGYLSQVLRGLDQSGLLCQKGLIKYTSLTKNFEQLFWALMQQPEREYDKKVAVMGRMERAFTQETESCPYKSNFDIPLHALLDLTQQTARPLQQLPDLMDGQDQGESSQMANQESLCCPICYDERPQGEFVQMNSCPCKDNSYNKACKGCLKRTLQERLQNRRELNCLFCKGALKSSELLSKGILSAREIIDWQLQELGRSTEDHPNFVKCRSSYSCFNGHFPRERAFKDFLSKGCAVCGQNAPKCKKCKRNEHPDKTCQQLWSEWMDECAMSGAHPCPKCWTPIQRDGGCMHLNCPQCKTNFSVVTNLPMDMKKVAKHLEYDIGGWPIKYFYKDGVYQENGRIDQEGRSIDAYGNLITRKKVKLAAEDGEGMVETTVNVIVSRDGRRFFEYNPKDDTAWEIDGKTLMRKGHDYIPREQFSIFRGKWDQIILKIQKDLQGKSK